MNERKLTQAQHQVLRRSVRGTYVRGASIQSAVVLAARGLVLLQDRYWTLGLSTLSNADGKRWHVAITDVGRWRC